MLTYELLQPAADRRRFHDATLTAALTAVIGVVTARTPLCSAGWAAGHNVQG
jgi:hypothetical protein